MCSNDLDRPVRPRRDRQDTSSSRRYRLHFQITYDEALSCSRKGLRSGLGADIGADERRPASEFEKPVVSKDIPDMKAFT